MREELIRLENVCFSYDVDQGKKEALKGIDLSIAKGEYISVVGHNGSGKSTLAKILNLILTPTSGTLTVDGLVLNAGEITEYDLFAVRRKIGMVFQNPDDQLVATVVREDVAFGPENLGVPREEIRRRVEESLEAVGMTAYEGFAPHKLSGGQKQRIAIAGVLAMKPLCIIFDESTAMLDPKGRKDILATMERLNREGITIIHITHHMNEAVRAERTILLSDGEIQMDGTPKEIFAQIEKVRSFGLDIPQGADLIDRLRQNGLPLPCGALTEEECVAALLSLFEEVRQ